MDHPELPVLLGNRVLLRQPIPDDISVRIKIPANPELHRMYGGSGRPNPTSVADVRKSLQSITDQDTARVRHFVIAARVQPDGQLVEGDSGQYIGHIRLTFVSRHDHSARVSLGIYDRNYWSKGYGTEALYILLRHAFESLHLHRVDLLVVEYNARAIRSYEKCGFVREGILRESALVDGVWYSDIQMSILDHEFRVLPRLATDSPEMKRM